MILSVMSLPFVIPDIKQGCMVVPSDIRESLVTEDLK